MITYTKSLLRPLSLFCNVKPQLNNQESENPQLRDRRYMQDYTDYHKSFYPQHIKNRQRFTLYSFMSCLPISIAQKVGRLAGETKTFIQSDNLYLPRLTPNGVPIYDSLRAGSVLKALKSAQIAIPLLYVATVKHPFIMAMISLVTYFGIYRNTYTKLGNTLVVKMELIPETKEIIYKKIGSFGITKTNRVKISDLEYFDRSQLNDLLFYRSTRNFIDKDLMFRVKSTGEILTFDQEGLWYEQGINHELMI